MNNDIKIEDDFLSEDEHRILVDRFTDSSFTWYLNSAVSRDEMMCDQKDNYQLCHHFYTPNNNSWPKISEYIDYLTPFFEKMTFMSLSRIKVNLNPRTSEIVRHGFHVDFDNIWCRDMKVSLFYLNTTDGYTEFEDGTRIEGIGNRLVTFPFNLKHTGTTCTDQPFRIVINLNYF